MRQKRAALALGAWILLDLAAHVSNITDGPSWIAAVPFEYGTVPYEVGGVIYWGIGFLLWFLAVYPIAKNDK